MGSAAGWAGGALSRTRARGLSPARPCARCGYSTDTHLAGPAVLCLCGDRRSQQDVPRVSGGRNRAPIALASADALRTVLPVCLLRVLPSADREGAFAHRTPQGLRPSGEALWLEPQVRWHCRLCPRVREELVGHSCTLPTQYCVPVPWSVVPTGTSSNVPWTGCHALEPAFCFSEPRSPGDACNVRLGGGTAFRR
jgi:hypothetical protein